MAESQSCGPGSYLPPTQVDLPGPLLHHPPTPPPGSRQLAGSMADTGVSGSGGTVRRNDAHFASLSKPLTFAVQPGQTPQGYQKLPQLLIRPTAIKINGLYAGIQP